MGFNDNYQPRWPRQPGLLLDEQVEHLPHYNCGELRAQPPDGLDRVLPTFMAHDPSHELMTPQTECILVALDFKYLCMNKAGKNVDGGKYRFRPLTEVGFAYLDMRKVLHGRNKGIPPGDRGSSWFRLMSPIHYIVEEYQDHWGHLCRFDGYGTETFLYAFGKSKIIPESHAVDRLENRFQELQKKNLTAEEIKNKVTRQLIILAFGATSVEITLGRLGLPWLNMPNVRIMDVQRDFQFEAQFSSPKVRLEYVMESLGLRFEDNNFGNLSHCAGNTAVFIIQVFLALFYKNQEQSKAFADRASVPWLPYTWVGQTLDQVNIAPGGLPRARQRNLMNRNDMPQRKDLNAFY